MAIAKEHGGAVSGFTILSTIMQKIRATVTAFEVEVNSSLSHPLSLARWCSGTFRKSWGIHCRIKFMSNIWMCLSTITLTSSTLHRRKISVVLVRPVFCDCIMTFFTVVLYHYLLVLSAHVVRRLAVFFDSLLSQNTCTRSPTLGLYGRPVAASEIA